MSDIQYERSAGHRILAALSHRIRRGVRRPEMSGLRPEVTRQRRTLLQSKRLFSSGGLVPSKYDKIMDKLQKEPNPHQQRINTQKQVFLTLKPNIIEMPKKFEGALEAPSASALA